MKLLSITLSALLLALCLCACGGAAEDDTLEVVTTSYPLYLLTCAVAEGAEGLSVTAMVNQSVACLHDYTLTVTDMRRLEGAELVLLNGAGLEDFLSDALEGRTCVDCSAGIALLTDEEGEIDPHIWMDPVRAAQLVRNIAQALAEADPAQSALYLQNGADYAAALEELALCCRRELSALSCRQLITFHEGFAYFAESMGLELLAAVEEEAGSETSARELLRIVALIEDYQLPAIFTEENGSTATPSAIVRECGVQLFSLSMLMSGGEYSAENTYEALLWQNVLTIKEALG